MRIECEFTFNDDTTMARLTPASGAKRRAKSTETSGWRHWIAPRLFGRELPWYWTPIALVVLVIVLHLQIRVEIRKTAFWLMQPFEYLGSGSLRNVSYGIDGKLGMHEISFVPDPDVAGIRIGEAEIEPPGLWWVAQQVLPRDRPSRQQRALNSLTGGGHDADWYYPPTPQLTFRLRNIEWGDFYLGYVVERLDWVGSYSGALFEAEGCPNDAFWARSDLSDRLQLDPGNGDIEIRFQATGEKTLKRTLHFGHPGLSQLTIESNYELPGPSNRFLDQMSEPWRTTSTSWSVEDHGFIKRRNEYCAQQAGVDVDTLVDRHLQSVQRLLAVNGVRPSDELLATYAEYARNGGTLNFATHLAPGRAWEDYSEAGLSGILDGIAATVTVGGNRSNYVLIEIPERPLPDIDYGSTWGLIEIERGSMPAPASTTAQTTQSETAPTTPKGPRSVPVDVAMAAMMAPKAKPVVQTFDAEALDQYIGQRVELRMEGNRRMRGLIESVTARHIELRVSMGGGHALLTLTRDRVIQARKL